MTHAAIAGMALENGCHRPFIKLVSLDRSTDQRVFLIPGGTGTFNHVILTFLDCRRYGRALEEAFVECERHVRFQKIELNQDDVKQLTRNGYSNQGRISTTQ